MIVNMKGHDPLPPLYMPEEKKLRMYAYQFWFALIGMFLSGLCIGVVLKDLFP